MYSSLLYFYSELLNRSSVVGSCLYNSCSLFQIAEKMLATLVRALTSRVLSEVRFLCFSSHLFAHSFQLRTSEGRQNVKCLCRTKANSLHNSFSLCQPCEEKFAALLEAQTLAGFYLQ